MLTAHFHSAKISTTFMYIKKAGERIVVLLASYTRYYEKKGLYPHTYSRISC